MWLLFLELIAMQLYGRVSSDYTPLCDSVAEISFVEGNNQLPR